MFKNCSIAFPARDAFYRGLSKEFYHAFSVFRNVFEEASDYMNEDLYNISYVNSKRRPDLHTVCLITHCMALYQLLRLHMEKPRAAIGFSQGEFTAAAAAGAVSLPDILKLVYELELLLISDTAIKNGSMVRVMELERETLKACCDTVDPDGESIALSVAYSNGQNAVSGRSDKILELSRLVKEKGARWVIPLDAGGAFHSPLCRNILSAAGQIFDRYQFKNAEYAVFSCVDGKNTTDGKAIKEKLSMQIARPILWDVLIKNQKKYGCNCILELGPGCTVSGNTRIIDDSISCKWINDLRDLEKAISISQRCLCD